MSIGMVLISIELLIMLCILLFIPERLRGNLLHRFGLLRRISGRRGASRGGRPFFTKDCGHRVRFNEDRFQD